MWIKSRNLWTLIEIETGNIYTNTSKEGFRNVGDKLNTLGAVKCDVEVKTLE